MLLLFIVVFSSTQCDSLFTCAGHGNDGPIEGLWKCVEHGVGLVLLKRVAQAREDQHAHAHSHAQKKKFPGRRIK